MKPIPRLADDMRIYLATEKMENCQPLITSVNNEIAVLVKNKKFAKAVGFSKS